MNETTNLLAMTFASTWWVWLILGAVMFVCSFKEFSYVSPIRTSAGESFITALFKVPKDYLIFMTLGIFYAVLMVIALIL